MFQEGDFKMTRQADPYKSHDGGTSESRRLVSAARTSIVCSFCAGRIDRAGCERGASELFRRDRASIVKS